MNILTRFFAFLRLREAVRKADHAWRLTHRRHYVLPGARRSLIVMDRANFRILKRKGYIPQKASAHDAVIESFYFTPHGDGSGYLSEKDRRSKLRQYFAWYAAQIKTEKEQKHKEKENENGKVQRNK